jgi:hypothetical protein
LRPRALPKIRPKIAKIEAKSDSGKFLKILAIFGHLRKIKEFWPFGPFRSLNSPNPLWDEAPTTGRTICPPEAVLAKPVWQKMHFGQV